MNSPPRDHSLQNNCKPVWLAKEWLQCPQSHPQGTSCGKGDFADANKTLRRGGFSGYLGGPSVIMGTLREGDRGT